MKAFAELSPQEVVAFAIGVEQANARRYRDWSIRFRPFDAEASALLEELAAEERDHERRLVELYREQFGEFSESLDPRTVDASLELRSAPAEQHFFVVDAAMARRILAHALDAEIGARRFYESALERAEEEAHRQLFEWLARFEDQHVWSLQARLEFYPEEE